MRLITSLVKSLRIQMFSPKLLVLNASLLTMCLGTGPTLIAADQAAVQKALTAGTRALLSELPNLNGADRTLTALAAMKGGANHEDPEIKKAVQEIVDRCQGDAYQPGREHIYEAGIDATLLADYDAIEYQRELTLIRDYIIGRQQPNGGWNYPTRDASLSGDTSVTQYGCLGLWAIARAGIEVDPQVWEKVLSWHVKYQNSDGGFPYFPGEQTGAKNGASEITMTINAVGSMHIAMINIVPGFEPLKDELPRDKPEPAEGESGPKFGILEEVNIAEPTAAAPSAKISPSALSTVKKAFGYIGPRYREINEETRDHKSYYYYSLERMAALANVQQIGSKSWYDLCGDFLLKEQRDDGSWQISNSTYNRYDTAFIVLFLSRSTGKLLKRVTPEDKFGEGLLRGGRGLPEGDLTDVIYDGRTIKGKEKPTEPLDVLLASLTKTGNIDALEAQEQIVKQIQIGDRNELIGKVDQLVELVDHDDATIRQTAIWALGRTGDMKFAQHIINHLSDPDLGVMIEARNALCWLARRPTGFGFPEDPTADLPPNATPEQKASAIAQWHKNIVLTWGQWYLDNRPFEDRGDAFEANLRKKMEVLKYGFEEQ